LQEDTPSLMPVKEDVVNYIRYIRLGKTLEGY
jgi:hypothetical protein